MTDHNSRPGVKLLSVFSLDVPLPGITIPTPTTKPVAVKKENISLNNKPKPWQSLGSNYAPVINKTKRQTIWELADRWASESNFQNHCQLSEKAHLIACILGTFLFPLCCKEHLTSITSGAPEHLRSRCKLCHHRILCCSFTIYMLRNSVHSHSPGQFVWVYWLFLH